MHCSHASSRSLVDITRAPEYFGRAAVTVSEIRSTNERVEAVRLLEQATARLGAEVSFMVSVQNSGAGQQTTYTLFACKNPEWCFEYERLRLSNGDPWLEYALKHTEPIASSDGALEDERSHPLVAFASRRGFRSAVIVPIPSGRSASPQGMLCLGSAEEKYFDGEGFLAFKVMARTVALELHEWWLSRLGHELRQRADLSEMDLRLLRFEYEGKTTKQIARRLDLRVAQIDYRFSRINERLGTVNKIAAARLAAAHGLL